MHQILSNKSYTSCPECFTLMGFSPPILGFNRKSAQYCRPVGQIGPFFYPLHRLMKYASGQKHLFSTVYSPHMLTSFTKHCVSAFCSCCWLILAAPLVQPILSLLHKCASCTRGQRLMHRPPFPPLGSSSSVDHELCGSQREAERFIRHEPRVDPFGKNPMDNLS